MAEENEEVCLLHNRIGALEYWIKPALKNWVRVGIWNSKIFECFEFKN